MVYLKPSFGKLKVIKIYGFDIETYGKFNKFLMGSIVNEKEKYVFWDKKKMQNFILYSHKLRNSYLFATNLNFDFLGVFGDDINLLMKFRIILRNSAFINVKYKTKNYNINFLDTMNYAKFSVKKLGKIIGIDKLEQPDFLGQKIRSIANKKILEDYNIRDSYITFKFAEFLQNTFNNNLNTNLKYTIASTSLDMFRRNFLNIWIKQPERENIINCFKAYYGGRTEAFYRGLLYDKYYYDFNSLYPYVMQKYDYPFPNSLYEKNIKNAPISLIKKYHGISLCNIKCYLKNLFYPLLPYKLDNNKLIFPTGKFKGWYSHVELRKALKLGYKIKPLKTIYYEKTFSPFKKFVKSMYNLRLKFKKENNSMELPVKIAMNSLYGKFAQKLDIMNIHFIRNQKDLDKINEYIDYNYYQKINNNNIRYKIDTPNYTLFKDNKTGKYYDNSKIYYVTDTDVEKYPRFINPILSLYITSYARLELYKIIEQINFNNGIVYYCDTDSIMTNLKLEKTSNIEIGKLKLEHEIEKAIIIKPKFYFIKDKITNKELFKAKGLYNIGNYKNFINIINSKKFEYVKFAKFKESLRRNLLFNEKIEVIKHINLEDDKRIWKNNKINIKTLEKSKPINLV